MFSAGQKAKVMEGHRMKTLFIDMDNVLVDFKSAIYNLDEAVSFPVLVAP